MIITSTVNNGITSISIEGKLDTSSSEEAQAKLSSIASQGTKMLMNLEKLEFVSSIGLRIILMQAKELKKHGGELRICNLQTAVKEVFTISGFSQILNIFDSQDEALKEF